MTRGTRRLLLVSAAIGGVAAVLIVGASRIPFSSDTLRKRLIAGLAARLDADVQLEELTIHFQPNLRAVGKKLQIRYGARQDVPPLISVGTFTVDSSLIGLWRRRIDHVELEGLDIEIPPDREGRETHTREGYLANVVITELEASDAKLAILRRDDRPARTWYLHTLRLRSVGLSEPMPYEAVVTNAVPPGLIHTTGTFGPWKRDDPGTTPLDGRFTLDNADLGVFLGIDGTLSARGSFKGTLEQLQVDGQTETPDFMVTIGQHPLPLLTTYHAVIDATNGNTTLDPVIATFLDTSLTARGGVYEVQGVKGRVVQLDIVLDEGRLEDVMRLAVNTPSPPLTGGLDLTTAFKLPPGKQDVVDRLHLDGRFTIDEGKFTDAGVQSKVSELSRRASGRASEPAGSRKVTSNFAGRFSLGNGRLALPTVTFDVPGAIVELSGQYGMRQQSIDFGGNLFMEASISQTTTGVKSLLLRLADPFFRRNGVTVVPLKIEGTRADPRFSVDVRRAFRRNNGKQPLKPPRSGLATIR